MHAWPSERTNKKADKRANASSRSASLNAIFALFPPKFQGYAFWIDYDIVGVLSEVAGKESQSTRRRVYCDNISFVELEQSNESGRTSIRTCHAWLV